MSATKYGRSFICLAIVAIIIVFLWAAQLPEVMNFVPENKNLHSPTRPQGIGNNSSTTGSVIKSTSITIQNSSIATRRDIKTCIPHKPDKAGQELIVKYYGQPGRVEDRKCSGTRHPDICSYQRTDSGEINVSCDAKVCGSSDIQMASVDPQMGKSVTNWNTLSKDRLTASVQEAVKTNQERGFDFLFLRCGSNLQVFSFPPIFKKVEDGKTRSNINVNVIMLDSISRPHFYRTMPRVVGAFKKINEDANIKARALDFELDQSIGQQTFENIRPFFSGVLKDDNEISASGENTKAPIGMGVLYGAFQKAGYQTLFQEDLCWYDIWGSLLTNNQKRAVPSGDAEFKSRWKEILEKEEQKTTDHFGLTHFSCTVLHYVLKRTNHYDYPSQVCFNGQFYSWYFMDYITKVYTALQQDEKAKPLVSYMHFNTAHETTGKRMINLDANMAKFFIDMASFSNTLTVIFSDHGHKMTPFSYTPEGRRELFDPVFFMIVPDGVADKLGPERMGALETNQKRMFMLYDVHNAFMSLHNPQTRNSRDYLVTGIFSEIPANRTCADLFMLPLTRCKCEGFDEEGHIKDDAEDHKWLAEAAVGYMNDAIQRQYEKEDKDSKKNQGYGNCERLVGKSFTDVVKRFQGEFILTTMDVHVVPPNGYQEDEIYKVSVKQYSKPRQGVFFLSFVRVTKYNKFVTCQDKSVDIKLCACAKNQTSNNTKNGVLLENGVPRGMFGAETKVKNLDSNCLLFLRRDFGTFSFTLEVTNVCTDRTYKFSMTGSMDQRIFSTALPINRVLPPKTFFFLTSVFKYLSKVNQALNLRASIQVKKDGSSEFSSLGTVSVS